MFSGNMKGRITAGAVSAAVRELRPVEVVGLYEDVLERFQVASSSGPKSFGSMNLRAYLCTHREYFSQHCSGAGYVLSHVPSMQAHPLATICLCL